MDDVFKPYAGSTQPDSVYEHDGDTDDVIEAENVSDHSPNSVVELSKKKRSVVVDVGVALPETFARLVIQEVDDPHRNLEIPISLDQGAMIAMLLKNNDRQRPFLSEVTLDILNQYSMSVALVSIAGRKNDIFLAEITIVDDQGRQRTVPSRPSDAVLLALSCQVPPPIMVDETLFYPR